MLLMDTDKDGRISKKEWVDFMSKEFDRLGTDPNGYIDQRICWRRRFMFSMFLPQ